MCLKISTAMKDSYAASMVFSLSISREVKNGYPANRNVSQRFDLVKSSL